jgi:hypothetical protein
MGIFYGKLYNSHNRTFWIINGEKFIDETGLIRGHINNLSKYSLGLYTSRSKDILKVQGRETKPMGGHNLFPLIEMWVNVSE